MAAHMHYDDTDSVLSEEIEVLESIYIHELTVQRKDSGRPSSIRLDLHPSTGDDLEKQFVCMTLFISPTPQYPDEAPEIEIKNPRGISEDVLQRVMESMYQLAEDRQGGPMLYELTEIAKECLTDSNIPHGPCAICLADFTEGDPFMKTDCYHYFHHYCLARYVNYVTTNQEEDDDTAPPGVQNEEEKEEGVVCPICRLSISYDIEFLEQANEPVAKEMMYTATKESEQHLKDMAKVFARQKANGGIIDLEAEKNKYLVPKDLVISVKSTPDSSTDENLSDHQNVKTNYYDRRHERRPRQERPISRNSDRGRRYHPQKYENNRSRNNDYPQSRRNDTRQSRNNDNHQARRSDGQVRNNDHAHARNNNYSNSRNNDHSHSRNDDYPQYRKDSTQSKRSDSPQSKRSDDPQSKISDSPQSKRNDDPQSKRSDDTQSKRSDDTQSKRSDSPQSKRSDGPQSKRSDDPQSKRSDDPQYKRSDDPQSKISDSPQSKRSDSSQFERNDNPQFERSENPQSKRRDNPQSRNNDRPQSKRIDLQQPRRNDSSKSKRDDDPQLKRSDDPQCKRSDDPQSKRSDDPQPKRSDDPQSKRSDDPHSKRSDDPQSKRSDIPQSRNNENPQSRNNDKPQSRNNDKPQSRNNDNSQSRRSDTDQSRKSYNSQSKKSDNPQLRAVHSDKVGYNHSNSGGGRNSHSRRYNNDHSHGADSDSNSIHNQKTRDQGSVRTESLTVDKPTKLTSNNSEISDEKTRDKSFASDTHQPDSVSDNSSNSDGNKIGKSDRDKQRIETAENNRDPGVEVSYSSDKTKANQREFGQGNSRGTYKPRFTSQFTNRNRTDRRPNDGIQSRNSGSNADNQQYHRDQGYSAGTNSGREKGYPAKNPSRREDHPRDSDQSTDNDQYDRDQVYFDNRRPGRGRGRRFHEHSTNQSVDNRTNQRGSHPPNKSRSSAEHRDSIQRHSSNIICNGAASKQHSVESQSSRPPPGFEKKETVSQKLKPPPGFETAS